MTGNNSGVLTKDKNFGMLINKVNLVIVEESQLGQRLDNFLMRFFRSVPRAHIYRLIRKGQVRVDKKRCKPEYKLSVGEVVRVPPVRVSSSNIPDLGQSLKETLLSSVLLETDDCIVINKPSGLAVHLGTGVSLGLIEALRQVKPDWANSELAHRLDRETSGCIIISKNNQYLRFIQDKFRTQALRKEYIAVVHGDWLDSCVTVRAPLQKDKENSGQAIVRVNKNGKVAKTEFYIEKSYGYASVIKAVPKTGRTHQIRVHCQYSGHGIVGDRKYTSKGYDDRLSKVSRLYLHSNAITFPSTLEGDNIRITAPMDEPFSDLLKRLSEA